MGEPAVIRIVAAVICLLGAAAQAQPHPDSCQALIPRSLADSLARAFPGYRTPLETDNAPEDIRKDLQLGGTGCLGVDTADFTGEGKKDYVLGLTALKGSGGLAVVAVPTRGGWRFQRIRSRTEDARYQQYVRAAEPGRYDRPAALTTPLESGERASIECRNRAAMVGSIESTVIVYCHEEGRWLYVRTSR
jgi:hypothetical protein